MPRTTIWISIYSNNQDKSRHFITQTALTSNLDFDSLRATKNRLRIKASCNYTPGRNNTLFIRLGQKIICLPTQALLPHTREEQLNLEGNGAGCHVSGNAAPLHKGWPDPKLTFANVPPRVLNGGVAVDVGEQPQAEPVLVVGGVGEAIHQDAGGGRVERLPHAVVQLVVDDGAPVLRLFVSNCLDICKATMENLQPNSAGTQARGVKSQNPADLGYNEYNNFNLRLQRDQGWH